MEINEQENTQEVQQENIRHNWTGEYHKAQREKC